MTVDPDDPYGRPAQQRAAPNPEQDALPAPPRETSADVAERLAATAREHGSTAPIPYGDAGHKQQQRDIAAAGPIPGEPDPPSVEQWRRDDALATHRAPQPTVVDPAPDSLEATTTDPDLGRTADALLAAHDAATVPDLETSPIDELRAAVQADDATGYGDAGADDGPSSDDDVSILDRDGAPDPDWAAPSAGAAPPTTVDLSFPGVDHKTSFDLHGDAGFEAQQHALEAVLAGMNLTDRARVRAAIKAGYVTVEAVRSVTDPDFELDGIGMDDVAAPHADAALQAALTPQLGLDLGDVPSAAQATADKLTDRFLVPPFSTLDSRAGYWKERKRAWLGLGIQSELGRDVGLAYRSDSVLDPDFYYKKQAAEKKVGRTLTIVEFRREHYQGMTEGPPSISTTGTSIFDPVLCEILFRWFTPHGGVVVDPFAGGSVRGIVGAILGRRYVGVELRPEQVEANKAESLRLIHAGTPFAGAPLPEWHQGSAVDLRDIVRTRDSAYQTTLVKEGADGILTCPPYADLEVYSDDPRDLSAMPYPVFRAMLSAAMAQAAELLAPDRFACWVVGEARDPKTGLSYGIIRDTVNAAIDAGLHLYNEAILQTAVGSGAMRATKQVTRSRKLVRVHQHVLVFVKGDPVRAAEACGDVIIGGAEA